MFCPLRMLVVNTVSSGELTADLKDRTETVPPVRLIKHLKLGSQKDPWTSSATNASFLQRLLLCVLLSVGQSISKNKESVNKIGI